MIPQQPVTTTRKRAASTRLDAGGRYEKRAKVGQGTYACVYAALDTQTQSNVAIKLFHPHAERVAKHEMRWMKRLAATGKIVPAIGQVKTDENRIGIVMPLLSSTLSQEMRARRLCIEEAVEILYQILEALVPLETKKLAHGDIKPENIMLEDAHSTRLKLIDLGLLRVFPLNTSGGSSGSGSVPELQTLGYRAPEVAMAAGELYGPAMDVWSAGCVGVEMLACQALFRGVTSVQGLLDAHRALVGLSPQCIIDASRDAGHAQQQQQRTSSNSASNVHASLDRLLPSDIASRSSRSSTADRQAYLDFLVYLLDPNPLSRPTASDALKHSIFASLSSQGSESVV